MNRPVYFFYGPLWTDNYEALFAIGRQARNTCRKVFNITRQLKLCNYCHWLFASSSFAGLLPLPETIRVLWASDLVMVIGRLFISYQHDLLTTPSLRPFRYFQVHRVSEPAMEVWWKHRNHHCRESLGGRWERGLETCRSGCGESYVCFTFMFLLPVNLCPRQETVPTYD